MSDYKEYITEKIVKELVIVGNGNSVDIQRLVETLTECFDILKVRILEVADSLREVFGSLYFEDDSEYKHKDFTISRSYNHKLDFSRPTIRHQVNCRRPRHAVKKIIR